MNNVSKRIRNALNNSTYFGVNYMMRCITLTSITNTNADQKYILSHVMANKHLDPFEKAITIVIATKNTEKEIHFTELTDIRRIITEISEAPKPVNAKKQEDIFKALRSLNISLERYPKLMDMIMSNRLEGVLKSTNLFDVIEDIEYLDKNPYLPTKYYPVIRAHLKLLTGYPRNKNLMNEKVWSLFNNSKTNIRTLTSLAWAHMALVSPKYKEDWTEVLEYDAVLRRAGARIQNPVYLATWKKIAWQLEQSDWEDYIGDLLEFTRRTLSDPHITPTIAKMATRAFLQFTNAGYLENKDLMNVHPSHRKNLLPAFTRKQRANGLNMARYSQELLKNAKIRVLCGNAITNRKRKTVGSNNTCEPTRYLYRAFQDRPIGDALDGPALMYTYMNERGFRHVAGYGSKYQYLYKYEIIKPLPLLDLNRGVLCRPTYKTFLEKTGLMNMHGNYAGSDPQPIKAYQEYLYAKRGIMGHVAVAQLDCHRKKVVERSTIISRTKSTRYKPNYSRGVGTITRGLETNQRTRNAFEKNNYQKEIYGNAEVVLYLPKKRREYLRLVEVAKINAKGGLGPWVPV